MVLQLGLFAMATAVLALTPGPNTALTLSSSASQGRRAGALVLFGVEMGFLVHLFLASAGLTALLLAIPLAYDTLRIAGAIYLLYIAIRMVRGSGRLHADLRGQPKSASRLIGSGFVSNALNPKTAAFYLAIFPQFVDPRHGSLFLQSLTLGMVHIAVSTSCNLIWVFGAGSLAAFLERRPAWERAQRWLFGTIIGAFALKLLTERRPATV